MILPNHNILYIHNMSHDTAYSDILSHGTEIDQIF